MPGQDGPNVLRLSSLPRSAPRSFSVRLSPADITRLAAELGLQGLRKVRFEGALTPEAGRDWTLHASLGATVIQPCVVTDAPVTTRIEVDVTRRYSARYQAPQEGEGEMPDDDTIDPLPASLSLEDVLVEALALELPAYPRATDAAPGDAAAAPPGVAPMRDEDTKPFAGLQALRDKLAGDEPDNDN